MATTCTCSKQHEKLRMFGTNLNKHILNRATGITNTTEHWYHPVTIVITNSHKNHKDPLSKEKRPFYFFLFFFFLHYLFFFTYFSLLLLSLPHASYLQSMPWPRAVHQPVRCPPNQPPPNSMQGNVEELEHSRLARGTRTRG